MRLVLKAVQDAVALTETQLASLDEVSDSTIEAALKRLKNAKDIKNAPAFFMYLIRESSEQQTPSIKAQIEASAQQKTKTPETTQKSQKELNDRYTAAEIDHCEKILALYDKICIEDPAEGANIATGQYSERWSRSWSTPDAYVRRIARLKGES